MNNSLILIPQHYCYYLVKYPGRSSDCEPEWCGMLRGCYGLVSIGDQATTGIIKPA